VRHDTLGEHFHRCGMPAGAFRNSHSNSSISIGSAAANVRCAARRRRVRSAARRATPASCGSRTTAAK
jgi:hypothetical protein